jgi:hypothetical protein
MKRRMVTPIVVGVLVSLAFFAFLVFLAVRDTRASDRCEDIGGQTWDSGKHCVIGGKIVSTR